MSIGVPIKLLHEGEGHVVTVELKNGETYRGMLTEAEDSMNCQMKEGEYDESNPIAKYLYRTLHIVNSSSAFLIINFLFL